MQMKIDVVVLWDHGRFECLVFDDSCPECASATCLPWPFSKNLAYTCAITSPPEDLHLTRRRSNCDAKLTDLV